MKPERPPERPHVTDHALIRYLERVIGLDVDGHRRAIAARVEIGVLHGAAAVISGGYRYTLSENRVTTVMPAHFTPLCRPHREDEA